MYTLKQAAEACGRGKPAVLKAIQKGKISAVKNPHGEWQIDPAELHRVYPLVVRGNTEDGNHFERYETGVEIRETASLKREISLLSEQTALLKNERDDLRRRLDQSEEERRETQNKLTAFITYQPEKVVSSSSKDKARLWQRIFSRH